MPLISRLQDVVTRKPLGLARTLFWIGVCVAVPTAARMALDPLLGSTLWFPTYYPAALIGTLFLGWRAGLVLMLLSALAANYFFVPPRQALTSQFQNIAGTVVFLMADGLIVLAAGLLQRPGPPGDRKRPRKDPQRRTAASDEEHPGHRPGPGRADRQAGDS